MESQMEFETCSSTTLKKPFGTSSVNCGKIRTSCPKALLPILSSQCLTENDASLMEYSDSGMFHDPNRRSSLGAESLLEHDITEDGTGLDNDGIENQLNVEAQLGLEYADDIFILNRSRELIYHPRNCMADQPQVTEYMRCTLVHWLIKVSHQLQFGPETIFIAVSLADRFLASTPIAQDCLQLVCVCALFIAAKLEESSVPGISVLVSLCGNTYRHHHFRRMETLLLSTLEFELHAPTSWFFTTNQLLKLCQSVPVDRRMFNVARYTVETCLGSYSISQFLPSEQATAALSYSCIVLYSPTSVHRGAFLSLISHDEEEEEVKEEVEEEEEKPSSDVNAFGRKRRKIFHAVASFNTTTSALVRSFGAIFSSEELDNIENCIEAMILYMEPLMQTVIPEFASSRCSTTADPDNLNSPAMSHFSNSLPVIESNTWQSEYFSDDVETQHVARSQVTRAFDSAKEMRSQTKTMPCAESVCCDSASCPDSYGTSSLLNCKICTATQSSSKSTSKNAATSTRFDFCQQKCCAKVNYCDSQLCCSSTVCRSSRCSSQMPSLCCSSKQSNQLYNGRDAQNLYDDDDIYASDFVEIENDFVSDGRNRQTDIITCDSSKQNCSVYKIFSRNGT